MKVLLAASGSGGHIYPALALKNRLIIEAEVGYVIVKGSLEEKLVDDARVEKMIVEVKNQARYYLRHPMQTIKLYKVIRKLAKRIKKYDKVICFGGFITCIVGLAAKMANVPIYLHEQNAIIGDANKVILPFARKIFTVYEDLKIPDKYRDKVLCLGNPRASEAYMQKSAPISEVPFKILFAAGSLGSETLVQIMKKMLEEISFPNTTFTIISGSRHLKLLDHLASKNNISVLAYSSHILSLMGSSHLLILRAGATSITEMMALQTPAIVIPSPYVKHDHQKENAAFLQKKGLAVVIEEKDLSCEYLAKTIIALQKNYEKRLEMKIKMRQIAKINAAKNITEELLKS